MGENIKRGGGKMGFLESLKKIFSLTTPEEEAVLARLREKHGIKMDDKDDSSIVRQKKNRPGDPDYDVWEDLRNMRANFFLGSWVTRKFRPVGEEKLKKQLEEAERKRQEAEARKGKISG
jgi:hypothetical protein